MSIFKAILYSGGLVFIAVGTLHLTLGLNADVMLGATLPPAVIADPVLDSQNRFYGVSFALYGILLWLFARDMQRYAPVFTSLSSRTTRRGREPHRRHQGEIPRLLEAWRPGAARGHRSIEVCAYSGES